MFIFLARSVLLGLLVSQSVMVCLSLAGVSKAVENINKIIAPALVRNQVGPFTLSSDHCCLLVSGKKEMKIVDQHKFQWKLSKLYKLKFDRFKKLC